MTLMLGEVLEPVRPLLAVAQQAGEVEREKVSIIASALERVDRRGFTPADIATGEQLLTEHAVVFPAEGLKLLADKLIDAIDPDGTLPNDELNTDRPASGAVLDLGRTRRTASRPQAMASIARDGGCSFPGSAHPPQYCERHHIRIARRRSWRLQSAIPASGASNQTGKKREWVDGGLTNLNNLTLLCIYHHHNFLARSWTCRMNTDGLPECIPPKWVDRDQKPMINTRI